MPDGPGPTPGPWDGPTPPQQPVPMPPGPPEPLERQRLISDAGSPSCAPSGNLISGATTTVGSAGSLGISFGTITAGGAIWVAKDARGGLPCEAGKASRPPPPPPL